MNDICVITAAPEWRRTSFVFPSQVIWTESCRSEEGPAPLQPPDDEAQRKLAWQPGRVQLHLLKLGQDAEEEENHGHRRRDDGSGGRRGNCVGHCFGSRHHGDLVDRHGRWCWHGGVCWRHGRSHCQAGQKEERDSHGCREISGWLLVKHHGRGTLPGLHPVHDERAAEARPSQTAESRSPDRNTEAGTSVPVCDTQQEQRQKGFRQWDVLRETALGFCQRTGSVFYRKPRSEAKDVVQEQVLWEGPSAGGKSAGWTGSPELYVGNVQLKQRTHCG